MLLSYRNHRDRGGAHNSQSLWPGQAWVDRAGRAFSSSMRRYSLTHEQVRDLAPDLAEALGHHRFCQSRRHTGDQLPASWMELTVHQSDAELPVMWATCERCHRNSQRRTWWGLRARPVLVQPQPAVS